MWLGSRACVPIVVYDTPDNLTELVDKLVATRSHFLCNNQNNNNINDPHCVWLEPQWGRQHKPANHVSNVT